MKSMKMIVMTAIMTWLLYTFVGCGYAEGLLGTINTSAVETNDDARIIVSVAPDLLVFSSVEEFLSAYQTVMSGRATGELAYLARSIDLASMSRFYLPVGIPEAYHLYRLDMCEYSVGMWFLPKEYLVSEDTIRSAETRQQHFLFHHTRHLNLNDPMAGIMRQRQFDLGEDDLIDGRYVFVGDNSFFWGEDGEIFGLYVPIPSQQISRTQAQEEFTHFSEAEITSMASFAATEVIDLHDTARVNALIGDFVETSDQGEIESADE